MLAATIALVFCITLLAQPRNGGGWLWDFGGALGLLALAGLLFQMRPRPPRLAATHRRLGWWLLATTALHALWYPALDGAVWTWLAPGAPIYMWLGLAALLVLAALSLLARMPDRARIHSRHAQFLHLHRLLGTACITLATLHVVLSGFYLPLWTQAALLSLLALAAVSRVWTTGVTGSDLIGQYLVAGSLAVAGFVLLRDLGA